MSQELIMQVATPILIAIIGAISTLLIYALQLGAEYLKKKIAALANDQAKTDATYLLLHAEQFIQTAVEETNQLLTDGFKQASETYTLTPQQMNQVLQTTFQKISVLMGEKMLTSLTKLLPDRDVWIAAKIQQYVGLAKKY